MTEKKSEWIWVVSNLSKLFTTATISVCVPSHNSNLSPPLWRQQERRLTSGTMEQLLISINRLRLTRGFMRLRAFFFIPFIWVRFLSWVYDKLEILRPPRNQKSNNTTIFVEGKFIEKPLSMTKQFKCHKTCFLRTPCEWIIIILLNT